MDKATFIGLMLAMGGILLGLILDGGNLGQVLQPTAALIVFSGTLGAILIQYPLSVALSAFRRLAQVFVEPGQTGHEEDRGTGELRESGAARGNHRAR